MIFTNKCKRLERKISRNINNKWKGQNKIIKRHYVKLEKVVEEVAIFFEKIGILEFIFNRIKFYIK